MRNAQTRVGGNEENAIARRKLLIVGLSHNHIAPCARVHDDFEACVMRKNLRNLLRDEAGCGSGQGAGDVATGAVANRARAKESPDTSADERRQPGVVLAGFDRDCASAENRSLFKGTRVLNVIPLVRIRRTEVDTCASGKHGSENETDDDLEHLIASTK